MKLLMRRMYLLALKHGYTIIMCKQIEHNVYRVWFCRPQWTDHMGEPVGFELSPDGIKELPPIGLEK